MRTFSRHENSVIFLGTCFSSKHVTYFYFNLNRVRNSRVKHVSYISNEMTNDDTANIKKCSAEGYRIVHSKEKIRSGKIFYHCPIHSEVNRKRRAPRIKAHRRPKTHAQNTSTIMAAHAAASLVATPVVVGAPIRHKASSSCRARANKTTFRAAAIPSDGKVDASTSAAPPPALRRREIFAAAVGVAFAPVMTVPAPAVAAVQKLGGGGGAI